MGQRFLYIPHFNLPGELKIIRIIPRLDAEYFEVDYVYEFEEQITNHSRKNLLAIDLGLDNFASLVTSNETALIIEGRGLKSYNRWYNKKLAEIQSRIDLYRSRKLMRSKKGMTWDRNAVMSNFMHHAVNQVVNICPAENIDCVIVGDWGDMKRGLLMSRKTGQLFQQIPYKKFKKRLKASVNCWGSNTLIRMRVTPREPAVDVDWSENPTECIGDFTVVDPVDCKLTQISTLR